MTPDDYVSVLADEQYLPFAFRGSSADDVRQWQQAFRPALCRALGLDRIADRGLCDLAPCKVGAEALEDHVREEWTVQTEPGFRVPFYLLRPKGAEGPRPVVLTPHGHSRGGKRTYVGLWDDEEDRRQMVEGERDIALQAVREGYIAVAPDMRGFATLRRVKEIESDAPNSCLPMQLGAITMGRTLNGDRLWDLMRLLDYLETRPEADSSKIVVTGNSTGGWLSYALAALDDRVAVAVPSCTFATYRVNKEQARGCPCMYVPGLLTLAESYDVVGLIAPRPLLIVAGDSDPLAPVDSVYEAFEKLRAIYRASGHEDRCRLHMAEGGHRYYKAPVWPFVREMLSE